MASVWEVIIAHRGKGNNGKMEEWNDERMDEK